MKRHAVVSVIVLLAMARPGLAEPAPTNQPAEPFRAAYMHIDQVIGKQTDAAGRRAALAEALDAFKASGLHVVMPYVKDPRGGRLQATSCRFAGTGTGTHWRTSWPWPVSAGWPCGQ